MLLHSILFAFKWKGESLEVELIVQGRSGYYLLSFGFFNCLGRDGEQIVSYATLIVWSHNAPSYWRALRDNTENAMLERDKKMS